MLGLFRQLDQFPSGAENRLVTLLLPEFGIEATVRELALDQAGLPLCCMLAGLMHCHIQHLRVTSKNRVAMSPTQPPLPRGRTLPLPDCLEMPETKNLERETGFEPATSTLARSHSTTELLPLTGERPTHILCQEGKAVKSACAG
jgi:hypothetical protein